MKKKNFHIYTFALFVCVVFILSYAALVTGNSVKVMKKYHEENGVTCELCHKVSDPKSGADAKSCTWCHGSPEMMIEFTKHLEPNPHNSPHWGADLECTKCHREHSKSVNHCNQCHSYKFKLPQ